jgi:hypothetical protein
VRGENLLHSGRSRRNAATTELSPFAEVYDKRKARGRYDEGVPVDEFGRLLRDAVARLGSAQPVGSAGLNCLNGRPPTQNFPITRIRIRRPAIVLNFSVPKMLVAFTLLRYPQRGELGRFLREGESHHRNWHRSFKPEYQLPLFGPFAARSQSAARAPQVFE